MHIKHDFHTPSSFVKMESSSYFLRCSRIIMITVGLWPFKLNNRYLQMIYKVYSSILMANFYFFVVTLSIGFKYLIHSSELEKANFLQFLITYLFTTWKIFLVRSAPIKKLVKEIVSLEEENMASNKDIGKIQYDISRHNFRLFGSLLFVTSMAVLQFIIIFTETLRMWKKAESQGIEAKKVFIFAEWFPFDTEKLFDVIYFYQIWNAALAGGLIVATDTMFVSLVLFTLVRLKVLGNKMKNFGKAVEEYAQELKNLRKLILEHEDTIRYVNDLNTALKYYFLVDFLAKSYHISLVLLNILFAFKTSKIEFASHMTNSSILFVEVASLYIQANDVSLESLNLGTYIYESNWYEQSPEIKKSLHIMMLRTQQPLKFESAGIVVLGNTLFLKIIKAAYTYILFSNKLN